MGALRAGTSVGKCSACVRVSTWKPQFSGIFRPDEGSLQLLALALVTSPRTQRPHDLSNRLGLLSIYFYSASLQNKHKLCLSSPPLQRANQSQFLLFLKNFWLCAAGGQCTAWVGVNVTWSLLGAGFGFFPQQALTFCCPPALCRVMAVQLPACLLLVFLVAPVHLAAPRHVAVFHEPSGGSGDGEEASALPPAQPVTPGSGPTVGDTVGTAVTNSSAPGNVLDGLVAFFKEYMLLVVVVGSLAFVLLFIICAAVIVRQKHKASAYYPSSFPKKKYVDQRDKTGGPRDFSEVPEKAPDPDAEEPLDCGRQLQADILAAAQNLKSPHKAPLANGAQGEREGGEEEGSEHPVEPPPQNQDAEGVGPEATSAEGKETQDGCPST